MRLRILALLLVLAVGAGQAQADPATRLLEAINDARSEAGLTALTREPRLSEAAARHAGAMAREGFFAHTAPDGTDLADRIESVGYPYRFAGENLAAGYRTPGAVVAAWLNSPGHRQTLLDARATEAGTAFLPNVGGQPAPRLWVLVVGRRR